MLCIDFVLFACKRPREPQGLAAGFSLSIVLTLLSMIIDNESLPMVGGSLRLLPPLKLVAMI
jgi:hypothetical protein